MIKTAHIVRSFTLGMIVLSWPLVSEAQQPKKRSAGKELIGLDENGSLLVADENKAEVAHLAASRDTPANLRFAAIRGLATSGYSAASTAALMKAAEDRDLSEAYRAYAAFGLSNFTQELPAHSKSKLQGRLRTIVLAEGAAIPAQFVRTLLHWGNAQWLDENFANHVRGKDLELEILGALRPEQATHRLLEIYRADQKRNSRESYNRRASIGRTLLRFRDKPGFEILDTLLDAEAVPYIAGKPNHQYRHNVFASIARGAGTDFDYKHQNYHPSIAEAIAQFRAWWSENQSANVFPTSRFERP